MTVEDLLTCMLQKQYDLAFTSWEASFVRSVGLHPMNGKALSTRQGDTVIKIGKKHRDALFSPGSREHNQLNHLIRNPVYTNEPFVSETYPREVRFAGDNLLAFRFKMNEWVKRDIKALSPRDSGTASRKVFFAMKAKVWVVPVMVSNVTLVQKVIADHNFGYDDGVLKLLAEVESARGVAPHALYDKDENQIVLVTTDDHMLSWFAENILKGIAI